MTESIKIEDLAALFKKSDINRNGEFNPDELEQGGEGEGEVSRLDQVGEGEKLSVRSFLMLHWKRATEGLKATAAQKYDWFERIWNAYSEEGRHYHTTVHLHEMLTYFELSWQTNFPPESSRSEDEEQALLLATFFHDIIYNVRSGTNEEDSAVLFQNFADEVGMDSEAPCLRSKVVDYILATKKHAVSEENPLALSLFLDMDMAVLGKKKKAYLQYAALIRKEYSYVPHEVYCQKRADTLESFLQHPIFGTRVMFKSFEERARENLEDEIESLRKGLIPFVPVSRNRFLRRSPKA
jgi:predicted metal-dependent HD superfamily phosphohydrolase